MSDAILFLRRASLIGALCLGVSFSAFAAVKTWTGAGADANWSTAANWSPSGAPAATDDLIFPNGAARLSNNNDTAAGTTYASIQFTAPNPGYTLSGNAIQLSAGMTATNSSATNEIALPITLTASQNFMVTGDRLWLTGAINLNGNTLTVTTAASPAGIVEIRGGITGNGGLIAAGSGLIGVSSTASSFTGTTTINGPDFSVSGTDLGPSVVTVTSGYLQPVNSAIIGSTTINGGSLYMAGGGTNQHATINGLTMNFPAGLFLGMYTSSNFGQITVPGPLQLNNPTLTTSWLFTSAPGDTFMVLNPMTSAGTFNGLAEGSHFTANGRRYGITYVGGGSGHQVILSDDPLVPSAAIPTLSASGLAALSMLLLGAFAWRHRKLAKPKR